MLHGINSIATTTRVPISLTIFRFDKLEQEVTIEREGFVYIFVSNENTTQVDIHFDDFKITQTKSNVVQYNEYYPFGLQTSNSWTRENTTGNNFLYNAANELNANTGWYEMFYRGYDPALGRMLQVDPYAASFSDHTPYNYSLNSPVVVNDPSGGKAVPGPGDGISSFANMGSFGQYNFGHWSDGINSGLSDWNPTTGSQLYREGLKMGFVDKGGKLYDLKNGHEMTNNHGVWGYWESFNEHTSAIASSEQGYFLGEATIGLRFVEQQRTQGSGLDWAAGGRALVRMLVPFGNDIYPESEERGYDPNKKLIAATVPDLPIGPGGAKLVTNGIRLAKQLASEAQMAEKGIVVIKSGNLKEAGRLAQQYGGEAADWVKKTSSSFTSTSTTLGPAKFETHWYENVVNWLRVEFKTKFP